MRGCSAEQGRMGSAGPEESTCAVVVIGRVCGRGSVLERCGLYKQQGGLGGGCVARAVPLESQRQVKSGHGQWRRTQE